MRGDSKVESNDSPEIPDHETWGRHQTSTASLRGVRLRNQPPDILVAYVVIYAVTPAYSGHM